MWDSAFQPYLNTGTLFDVHTGCFVPGTHGGMVLNGGLAPTNSFMGRQQMFKSTEMLSYMLRVLGFYDRSELLTYDTETSLKKDRIVRFTPYCTADALSDRIVLKTIVDMTAEEFFEKVKEIVHEKLTHKDDYLVESPLIDPYTNKPMMIIIPTLVVYDSWSAMVTGAMQTTFDNTEIDSPDANTIFMKDGRGKKMIMMQIPTLASKGGLCFGFSAHLGDKIEMNSRMQSPKSLPSMRSTDKPKGVGSDFNFLISNAIDIRKVEALQESDKTSLYPIEGGSGAELYEATSILVRSKNNMSGTQLPMVISQVDGIMGDLSNYNYLRKHNEYFGLIGNKVTHKPAMTDTTVGRTTIRKRLEDPKVARAIELLAQQKYIQNNWVSTKAEVDFGMKPELLAEKLLASDKPGVSDILQSRGYWTYDKKNLQPYMSLYDVLAIAQGIYRAKGVSLVGLDVPKSVK